MLITDDIAQTIDSSVVCWLATIAEDGSPNVPPKKAFMHDGHGRILIAHIVLPGSVRNIACNPQVCVSFIEVSTQRGHKLRGSARVLVERDAEYSAQKSRLVQMVGDNFPIFAVIEVAPTDIERIVAPPPVRQPNGEMAHKFDGAEEECEELSAAFQQVANDRGCQFLDAKTITTTSKIDGVHIDEDPHEVLGLAVADVVGCVFIPSWSTQSVVGTSTGHDLSEGLAPVACHRSGITVLQGRTNEGH